MLKVYLIIIFYIIITIITALLYVERDYPTEEDYYSCVCIGLFWFIFLPIFILIKIVKYLDNKIKQ